MICIALIRRWRIMLPRMGQFAFNRPGMDRPQPGDSAAGTLQARSVNGAPNGVGSRSAVSADLGHRNPGKPVGAVVAATQVLRVHASERPLNASEVARAAGLHRGTAYNLLRTLQAESFVSYDETTRTYAVSLHILELAYGALRRSGLLDIARPLVQAIADAHGV